MNEIINAEFTTFFICNAETETVNFGERFDGLVIEIEGDLFFVGVYDGIYETTLDPSSLFGKILVSIEIYEIDSTRKLVKVKLLGDEYSIDLKGNGFYVTPFNHETII